MAGLEPSAHPENTCAGRARRRATNSTRGRCQNCLLQCSIAAALPRRVPVFRSRSRRVATSPRLRARPRARGRGTGRSRLAATRPPHKRLSASGSARAMPAPNGSIKRRPCARGSDDRAAVRQRIERHAADAVAEFGAIVRLKADAAREIRRVLRGRRRLPDERQRRVAHRFEPRDVRARRGVVLAVVIRRDLDGDRDVGVPCGEQLDEVDDDPEPLVLPRGARVEQAPERRGSAHRATLRAPDTATAPHRRNPQRRNTSTRRSVVPRITRSGWRAATTRSRRSLTRSHAQPVEIQEYAIGRHASAAPRERGARGRACAPW